MRISDHRQERAADADGAIRGALARAVESPEFRLSPRMSQLLRFLVETSLAKQAAELKESVIGVEVFGRPADYDPKADPVVRKEVRRLRLKLSEFYAGSGANETARIEIPKGRYVPEISFGKAAEGPAEQPSRRERRVPRWGWMAAAGFGVVLLAGTLVAVKLEGRRGPLAPQMLTGNGGDERWPALSPDGKRIAYSWEASTDKVASIVAGPLHGDAQKRLTTSTADESHPAWSPDGAGIAFVRRSEGGRPTVCVRRLADGEERRLTEIRLPDHLDWSRDGREIVTSDGMAGSPSAIIAISVESGGRRQITVPSGGAGDTFPRFSPDGSQLAFLRAVALDVAEVFLVDLKSPENPRRLTYENRKMEGYTWAPDGRSLVVSLARGATPRSLWRVPVSGGAMERIAAAGTLAYTPSWTVEGGALVFAQRLNDINLWRIRADGSGQPALVAGSNMLDSSPAFSPDGSRIAFRSSRSGTNEIWATDLMENRPQRLTWINGALTGKPNWSPDGKWIAFDSRVTGKSDVLIAPAGGGDWRKLTDVKGNSVIPCWSRDGQWVYFASDRGGRWEVWKQRPSGGAAQQVTWNGGYAAAESPDAKYLYYTRSLTEPGLYRMPLSGGEEEAVLPEFAGKLWGNWALASAGLFYLNYPETNSSTNSTIRYLDLTTRQSRDVYRLPKHPVLWDGGLAVSPDGQWLVYGQLDYLGGNIQVLEPFR